MKKLSKETAHRLSGGTLYNHFYRTNAEASPMKQLAPNLDDQIEKLEQITKQQIQSHDKLISLQEE